MPFINSRELAELLGVREKTVFMWRWRGIGPPYRKINGHLVRYDPGEIAAWIEGQAINPAVRNPQRAGIN